MDTSGMKSDHKLFIYFANTGYLFAFYSYEPFPIDKNCYYSSLTFCTSSQKMH